MASANNHVNLNTNAGFNLASISLICAGFPGGVCGCLGADHQGLVFI